MFSGYRQLPKVLCRYILSENIEILSEKVGLKNTWKWPLTEKVIKWKKKFRVVTIRVNLRPGHSGEEKFLKICTKFHKKTLNGS